MLSGVSGAFRFRKTTLSVALALVYAACMAMEAWSRGNALGVPSPEPEALRESWTDLERIARHPHPYTSRENDVVRGYLLRQVAAACAGKEYCTYGTEAPGAGQQPRPVMFKQGDTFNESSTEHRVVYFEPANVLVKVEGTDARLKGDGLLISAHYDSVPAGYGVTDDGMGVVTMLALLRKYTRDPSSRPRRTLLFNFNDDEEFGLMGSESFARHPWFREAGYFVNIDGAGSGGRALLLRATDYEVARLYAGAKNPLASSLLQQGFQDGVIHSQTDYYVYQANGLRGIDICFYEPRALYHTIHDSIQYASKGSLWQLLTSVTGYVEQMEAFGGGNKADNVISNKADNAISNKAAEAISNNAISSIPSSQNIVQSHDSSSKIDSHDPHFSISNNFVVPDLSSAVYFDFLSKFFFCISTESLVNLNIGLLVVVPLVLGALLLIAHRKNTWHVQARGWIRVPASLLFSTLVTWLFAKHCLLAEIPGRAPLYDSYRSAWLALTCLNIFFNYVSLTFASWLRPVHDQKLIGLLELTLGGWIVLVWATVQESRYAKTGLFLTTVLFACFSAGSFVGVVGFVLKRGPGSVRLPATPPEQPQEQPLDSADSATPDLSPENSSPELSDVSPEPIDASADLALSPPPSCSKSFDWLIQFLVVVPPLVFFIYAVGDLALDSMHQAGVDGVSGERAARKFAVASSIGLGLPVLPFLHKLNAPAASILGLTAVLASVYTILAPTHSNTNPLKVKFVQSIDLPAVSANSSLDIGSADHVEAYGTLRARPGFISGILSELPSLQDNTTDMDVRFVEDPKEGTETVTYKAERPWLFDSEAESGNSFDKYLDIEVLSNSDSKNSGSYEPLNAVLRIHAAQNRMCQLDFNASGYNSFADRNRTSPVKLVTVYNSSLLESGTKPGFRQPIRANIPSGYSTDDEGNHYYKIMQGIDMVLLHKLNWTQPYYQVALQWLPFSLDDDDAVQSRGLDVSVTCFWGELQSEVLVAGDKHRIVPAYDELLHYTPRNFITTNLKPGLVQVSRRHDLTTTVCVF
ncbi:hypothetical protein BRETT_001449 [Brettanomyces bruxellensis]|uniref:Peptide hydrolase n=1 Tax=Dekkera bruxellensis TaxID=5007 RepID=A0A871R598_DEKBR|nr:uncharacterized protein BRETT_001449 [Brettanomyces bruxellensis]QOU21723.1 hypothetical protein BRETT_001449 [Brettanomyces bruxellensis]